MHEQDDDAPMTPARDADDAPALATAADDWATAAPRDPEGPRCPWCSAPLADLAPSRCGACGAQLAGAGDRPIPGVTAVDPDAVRAAKPPAKPRKRRSVFSWLTGDVDLVDVPPPVPMAPADAARSGAGAGPGVGASGTPGLPPVTASTLGPVSPDALAPPDARLRLEMLKVELEALGLAPDEGIPPSADASGADAAADTGPPGGLGDSGSAAAGTTGEAPPGAGTPGPV